MYIAYRNHSTALHENSQSAKIWWNYRWVLDLKKKGDASFENEATFVDRNGVAFLVKLELIAIFSLFIIEFLTVVTNFNKFNNSVHYRSPNQLVSYRLLKKYIK